jgi:hypothetical protein
MALAGSCVVIGIMEVALFSGSVNDMTQIGYGLAAAANLVLTALTGKSVYSIVHIQCWKDRSAGRILWIQRAASHVGLDRTLRSRYNTAMGIMYDLMLYRPSPDIFQTRVWCNLLHWSNIPDYYCLARWDNLLHWGHHCGAANRQSMQFSFDITYLSSRT